MDELTSAIKTIQDALEYYSEGDFYQWEGCHCHGSYKLSDDYAEKAYDAQESLDKLKNVLLMEE